jgi:hypothetical protein
MSAPRAAHLAVYRRVHSTTSADWPSAVPTRSGSGQYRERGEIVSKIDGVRYMLEHGGPTDVIATAVAAQLGEQPHHPPSDRARPLSPTFAEPYRPHEGERQPLGRQVPSGTAQRRHADPPARRDVSRLAPRRVGRAGPAAATDQ